MKYTNNTSGTERARDNESKGHMKKQEGVTNQTDMSRLLVEFSSLLAISGSLPAAVDIV